MRARARRVHGVAWLRGRLAMHACTPRSLLMLIITYLLTYARGAPGAVRLEPEPVCGGGCTPDTQTRMGTRGYDAHGGAPAAS